MPNLTIERRLVKAVPDANPVPGHDLVIFRKLGAGGRRFHSVLGPDQKLGAVDRLLFGSHLEAYAVTRDQNLRYRFSLQELRSQEGLGPFSLSFTLSLSVADARKLVEGLERDPLRRLQEEIEEVTGELARSMSWDQIERPSDEVERRLSEADVRDEAGRRMPCLERLRGFALDLGLILRGVQIARTLSPEFGEENRAAQTAKRQQKILQAEHEVEHMRRKLQGDLEETQAWKIHALGNIERIGKISERAAGNLAKVLAQISDKVDSAPALQGVLQELRVMRQEIFVLASGPAASIRNEALEGARPSPREILADIRRRRFFRPADAGAPDVTELLREDRKR
jgi:hypothetical protein